MNRSLDVPHTPSRFSLSLLRKFPFLRKIILHSLFKKNHLKFQDLYSYQNRFFIYKVEDYYIPNESLSAPFSFDLQLEKAKNESLFEYIPKKGDTVIDIGAGLGEETLIYSKLVGENGIVFSIEANPIVFEVFTKTIALNQLKNVDALNAAISIKKGRVSLAKMTGSYEEVFVNDQISYGEIPSLPLSEYLREKNITVIDLLKINIEGGEKAALDSLSSEQFKMIRHAAIACHDFRWRKEGNEFFRTKEHIINVLIANGFEIHSRNTGVDYLDDWVYASRAIL